MSPKNRHLLWGCFTASLAIHIGALLFFAQYSIWFSSPQKVQEGEFSWIDRDQVLKSAFAPVSEEGKKKVHSPQKEPIAPFAFQPSMQLPEQEAEILFSLQNHPFLTPLPIIPTFSIPLASLNLLDHLPKDLMIPAPARPPQFAPLPTTDPMTFSASVPKLDQEAEIAISHSESISLPLIESRQAGKKPSMIPIPNLPKLPTLDELETSSYSDSFDADLIFLPKEEGNGYIFALTLIPKSDLELPRIRQHVTFLIDRSNSIQQQRLSATKSAVHKALEEMCSDDTFNIIAFDSKMEKLSPHPLPCTGTSYAAAEAFLEKIQLGSFFSSSDLYKPLFLTVPGWVEDDELYTAILLTDGEALAKKPAQRTVLHDWTQYNSGKVSLYAIGMNSDAHMAALDAAAVLNKGKLSNAPTNRGVKRKLLKLLKTIQHPVAKNLSCKAISISPQTKVHLLPSSTHMPHLYLDQPYVILGETDTLDDFILFVQGRMKDRWLNVKKTISFLSAKKGNKSLRQEWALQQAYTLYERYCSDNDPQHIAEAATLLEPFDYQVVFR